jgi:hypothetical protein
MLILKRYRPLGTGQTTRASIDAAVDFVAYVWKDYDPDAFTFLGTRRGERWHDHVIKGNRAPKIAAIIAEHPADRFDLYFCPNAFSEARRLKPFALPSRWALCDIDDADPEGYDPKPSILWETSPNRHQGLWNCHKVFPARDAERISRNLRDAFGGDKGGWSATKMLRIPGTINHKREYQSPVVTLRKFDPRPIKISRALRKAPERRTILISKPVCIDGLDHVEIMRRYRRRMGLVAGSLMTATRLMRNDRSGVVCSITAKLVELGATDTEIAVVLVNNVYFVSKWGTDLNVAFDQIARIRARSDVSR